MNTIYDSIILSLEETIQAIEEGKKKKYFHEKHSNFWIKEEQEAKEKLEEENRLERIKRAQLKNITPKKQAGKRSSPALQYQQAIEAHRRRGKPY